MGRNYEGTLLELIEPKGFWEDRETAFVFWDGEKLPWYLGKLRRKTLRKKARRFARTLLELGVVPGERVALMIPNMLQFPIAYFAALYAGLIVVPINLAYTATEILHVLKDSGARTIITLDRFYPEIAKIKEEAGLKHIIVTTPADSLPIFKKFYWHIFKKPKERLYEGDSSVKRFSSLLRLGRCSFKNLPQIKSDDIALIIYTSGTTGAAKGVVMTHKALMENAAAVCGFIKEMGLNEGKEVFAATIPYFHILGIATLLNTPLLARAKIVLIPDPRDFYKMLNAIAYTKTTAFVGTPGHYAVMPAILSLKKKQHDISSVNLWISGGDKLSRSAREKFEKLVGKKIKNGYGMSELGIVSCQRLDDEEEGSIGRPLMDVLWAIFNPNEEGIGELVVRTSSVMRGYWNKSQFANEVFDSGEWFHTGDLAKFSDGEKILLRGRLKYMIKKRTGENIDPFEIANVLLTHPLVVEAAVVGVPNEERGELIRACVVLRDTRTSSEDPRIQKYKFLRDSILNHCRQSLASFKIPDEVFFLEAFPKNAMGKVLYEKLKAL